MLLETWNLQSHVKGGSIRTILCSMEHLGFLSEDLKAKYPKLSPHMPSLP